jgi:hypothetical protein
MHVYRKVVRDERDIWQGISDSLILKDQVLALGSRSTMVKQYSSDMWMLGLLNGYSSFIREVYTWMPIGVIHRVNDDIKAFGGCSLWDDYGDDCILLRYGSLHLMNMYLFVRTDALAIHMKFCHPEWEQIDEYGSL